MRYTLENTWDEISGGLIALADDQKMELLQKCWPDDPDRKPWMIDRIASGADILIGTPAWSAWKIFQTMVNYLNENEQSKN